MGLLGPYGCIRTGHVISDVGNATSEGGGRIRRYRGIGARPGSHPLRADDR